MIAEYLFTGMEFFAKFVIATLFLYLYGLGTYFVISYARNGEWGRSRLLNPAVTVWAIVTVVVAAMLISIIVGYILVEVFAL